MWVDITMIRSTECYILQGRLGGGGVWICTFNNQFQPLEISAICLQYHYRNATEMRGNSLKIIHVIIVYCVDIKHHMPAAQTLYNLCISALWPISLIKSNSTFQETKNRLYWVNVRIKDKIRFQKKHTLQKINFNDWTLHIFDILVLSNLLIEF